jgi:hypothetical protein
MIFSILIFTLLISLYLPCILSFKISCLSPPRHTKNKTSLNLASSGNVPSDLSAIDRTEFPAVSEMIVPNIDVHELDGGSFLGVLLWTYVLYNGLSDFRPADITLTYIAKLLKQEDETWFKDFSDGYYFFCPPVIEFVRVSIFFGLGFLANTYTIKSLEGDMFWGWSIGSYHM